MQGAGCRVQGAGCGEGPLSDRAMNTSISIASSGLHCAPQEKGESCIRRTHKGDKAMVYCLKRGLWLMAYGLWPMASMAYGLYGLWPLRHIAYGPWPVPYGLYHALWYFLVSSHQVRGLAQGLAATGWSRHVLQCSHTTMIFLYDTKTP